MKKNWEVKKLGEVCEIKTGKKDVNQGNPNGEFPFFTCAREHTYSDEFSFDTEALLIAGNGDVGAVSYYKGKFEAYQRTYVLLNFKNISPRFLFLILDGYLKQTVSKQKLGNTMPYIKMGMLADFEIPFPPFLEQQHIVSVLDEAFVALGKARDNAQKNLQNAHELFESYLQSVFANPGDGWEEKKLGEVCEISSKLIDPREELYVDQYHVGGANIESMTGRLIDLKTSREEELISGKFTFNNLMILYSKIRPYLVKVARPDFSGLCSADIYPLKPIASILDRDFLYFLLLTKEFTDFAIKGSARAGMPKVNREHLFSYSSFFPSLTEQKCIVAKLDALSVETKRLEVIYHQKLRDLEELKKSILQKVFNGELAGVCS